MHLKREKGTANETKNKISIRINSTKMIFCNVDQHFLFFMFVTNSMSTIVSYVQHLRGSLLLNVYLLQPLVHTHCRFPSVK